MRRRLTAVDLFCGGGGTSSGLMRACEHLGINPGSIDLTAINHWDVAVATHAANHPAARHIQSRIEQIQPERVVPGGRADLLWASPECIHHSIARGGRPRDDQSRAQAWTVLDWVQRLRPSVVCIENVPEFMGWGPLYVSGKQAGKPIQSMGGQTFAAWVAALRSMNYRVEYRTLNCADFGDVTTRRRFFLIARRGNKRPSWPIPTHGQLSGPDLFGHSVHPWRPASEIIDWSIPGHSIFLTAEKVKESGLRIKRPLAENTMRRIIAGVERYWGEWAEPFLVLLRGTGDTQIKQSHFSTGVPLPTITAGGGHIGLIKPFLVEYYGTGNFSPVESPIPTITTKPRHGLAMPFIATMEHCGRLLSMDKPLNTLTTFQGHYLIEPMILGQDSRGIMRPVSHPLPTIASAGAHALVRPMIIEREGRRYLLDILFRMLTTSELAAAHSFSADYIWTGNKAEVMKQIGNSVPVSTVEAICRAAAGDAIKAAA